MVNKICIQLLILSGARQSGIRLARCEYLNFETDMWSVPSGISKACQALILEVTSKVEEVGQLLELEIDVDINTCKPFRPKDVVARVKAILSRTDTVMAASKPYENNLSFEIDLDRMVMAIGQNAISLTAVEFQMISLLYLGLGRFLSRDQLMTTCYTDYRIVSERTIDSHIKKNQNENCNHRQRELESVGIWSGAEIEFRRGRREG